MAIEYDNSAFYYFVITILSLYLFPTTFWAVRRFMRISFKKPVSATDGKARTMDEKRKLRELGKREVLWSKPFVVHMIILGMVWLIWLAAFYAVWGNKQIKQYDPCEILGLDATSCADPKAERSAFRKLSLKWHPDKNPPEKRKEAEEMFMKIGKAHEALTDEESKNNMKTWGSPDGRSQKTQVAIGLPSLFMNQDNHTLILIIYLLGTCVLVPVLVGYVYARCRRYDNMVMKQTYAIFQHHIKETSHEGTLPEVFCAAQEFADLKYSTKDTEQLDKLAKRFSRATNRDEETQMAPPRFYTQARAQQNATHFGTAYYNNVLLHYHLIASRGTDDTEKPVKLTKGNAANLNFMLKHAILLNNAMLKIAQFGGWFGTVTNIIDLSQKVTQAVWGKNADLLQLPNFSEESVRHVVGGGKRRKSKRAQVSSKRSALQNFLSADPESRKGMRDFTQEQKAEVTRVCNLIPQFEVEVAASVSGEPIIGPKDLVTATVTIFRKNLRAEEFTLQCQQGAKQNENSVKLSMGTYERHGKCNGKAKYRLIRVNEEAPTAPKHTAWLFYTPTGDDVTGVWRVGPEPITLYPDYEPPEFLGWLRSQQVPDAVTESPLDAATWFSSAVTERPKKTVEYKRKGYTMLEEDDEDDDVDLNVQMVPLQDNFLPETGIDCTLTQEAEEAGDVYAPYLPDEMSDDLHVICTVTRGPRKALHAIEKTSDMSREVEVKLRFWSPEKPGTYEFQLFVKSSCYVGCDVDTFFKIEVLPASMIPKVEAHPLDEKLKHEPTWQEQMLNPEGYQHESESDSDEDEDSEEANQRRQRKREEKEKAQEEAEAKRAAEESSDSEEDD